MRRSGKPRWADAVAHLAGFDYEEVKRHQRKGGKIYRTTQEQLTMLREISEKLGRAPTSNEANCHGMNAQRLRERIGGSWEDVLKAAGIDLNKRSKHAVVRSIRTETLIADVLAVSSKLGRIPTLGQYREEGRYPCSTVMRRLGGWKNVKKVVGERRVTNINISGGHRR